MADYAFHKGWLQVRDEIGEVAIRGWQGPQALRKRHGEAEWAAFYPSERLILPYRPSKKRVSKPRVEANQDQMAFDFFDQTAPAPVETSARELKKRAFEQFRFSLPKPVAHAVEPFLRDQWPLIVMLYFD
ncbi:MAG: hypothetical protein AAF226_18035, partial [Verrucomicrobiota bacterium]